MACCTASTFSGVAFFIEAMPRLLWKTMSLERLQIGEDAEYDKVIARYRSEGWEYDAIFENMKVVPVNFKEHKAMLGIAR